MKLFSSLSIVYRILFLQATTVGKKRGLSSVPSLLRCINDNLLSVQRDLITSQLYHD